jgi:hypothetical protein
MFPQFGAAAAGRCALATINNASAIEVLFIHALLACDRLQPRRQRECIATAGGGAAALRGRASTAGASTQQA